MEYTFLEQSAAFLYSLVLGGALWFLYEIIKILRIVFFNNKKTLIVTDILFMTVSSVATFLFALAFLNGSVRFYMILGELIGFAVLNISLGKAADRLLIPIINFIKRKIKKFINLLKKIMKKLLKNLYKVLYNIFEKIYKFVGFFKKHQKNKNENNKKGNANGRQKEKISKKGGAVQRRNKRSKAS
ncbi:MAG: spore cortex biosynthesis protein YabQ [Ruminococcus sp.]